MKLKITGRADRIDEENQLSNEDISNQTISIEKGDVILAEGPVSIEVLDDE